MFYSGRVTQGSAPKSIDSSISRCKSDFNGNGIARVTFSINDLHDKHLFLNPKCGDVAKSIY